MPTRRCLRCRSQCGNGASEAFSRRFEKILEWHLTCPSSARVVALFMLLSFAEQIPTHTSKANASSAQTGEVVLDIPTMYRRDVA